MRDRDRTILALALPIIGGMVSQNITNLIDLAMVGSLGDAAVAAVGIGSFANFMAIAFITGLSAGVQAIAARRMGEGRVTETAVPLNGALVIALAIGAPLTVVLFLLVPSFYPLLNPDPAVAAEGVPYLQARLCSIVAVGMNFAFRGYWNGVNLSRLYLRTLIVMHAVNIFLNWVLIFGNLGAPELGAYGAGISNTISMYVGTFTYFSLALRHARGAGFLRGLPGREAFRTIARLAAPTGVQQFMFASGYTALFWILGHIGMRDTVHSTAEVAAANALVNVTLVAVLPGIGLGITAASLVGQALGRGDPNDAYRWGWDVVRVGVFVMGLLGLPMLIAPDAILWPFLHDPETLAIARAPLRLIGASIAIDAVGMVLMNALLGAGASRLSLVVSVATQWLVFLPIAFVLGPVLGFGLFWIWLAQVGYRVLFASAFAAIWRRRAWAAIEV
jgi:MATE family multidrug resistance protein